ncbi:MAG: AMP-binding protein [Desulfobacter sp.]|nr:MAG: AMP-binding protein [Desulfobacter sp.]
MNNLHGLTLFDFFQKNALQHKNAAALHWDGKNISFQALFARTCALTAGLAALNLSPNARVAVLAKNHPIFFELFGAASALNLCLVLVNRRLSPEEMAHIIEDTTPSVLICDAEMEAQAETLAAGSDSLEHCFVIGKDTDRLYPENTAADQGLADQADPNAPYIIIHTAAVQGKPRGAVLSQENIILANLQIIHTFGLDPSKAYLNILPLFHIMGVNFGIGMFMAGGKNVIVEKFDPAKCLDFIQEQKITIFGSFPPILTNILDLISQEKGYDLSSLEIAAGLEIPDTVKKWEAATPSKFWTMYGQTETSGLITFSEYFKNPGSAGEISPLARIAIADDHDNILPSCNVGEILVKGPLVFQGYWNADDLNAFTFRQGWHHTGDMGLIDDKGFLFFKGRKAEKELIKPGGENVFPAEVEKAVVTHDAVDKVCVFGVPDPKFGEGIKAVCTLVPGTSLDKDELIAFTGTLIAGYKKPRYVEFIDEMPLAEDGSIDRAKVKELYG